MSTQRVLHVLEQLGSPSETFIVDRMLELDRLEWEAWVVARGLVPAPVVPFPPPARRVVWRRRDELARRLRPSRGGATGVAPWLERGIRRARPALLHAHFGWNGLSALPASAEHGLPLVVGLHGYDVCVFPRHGFDPPGEADGQSRGQRPGTVYAELFDRAAAILVSSRYLEGRLRELGYEQPVEVVPSGIRLDDFPFRGPRRAADEHRLLYVGRLVTYKGLDVALRALRLLADGDIPIRLDVVGEGPRRADFERLARELGLAAHVSFHGSATRAGVVGALERADLLLAPARTLASGQAEALGNSLKEALALGLEVVATDHGGHPEVVPPERRSELVAEGDPEALAAGIAMSFGDRANWPHRARRARAWVEERFDWRLLAPSIAAIYGRATGEASS